MRSIGIELDWRYTLATLGYMAVIFFLSSIPDRGTGANLVIVRFAMNIAHIPLYAGLAFFFVLALAGGRAEGALLLGPYWITLLGAGAYGVLDEWHQSFVPGRFASISDVLLDLVGVVGTLLILRLRSRQEARS